MQAMPLRRLIKSVVNAPLSPLGLTIKRVDAHDWSDH